MNYFCLNKNYRGLSSSIFFIIIVLMKKHSSIKKLESKNKFVHSKLILGKNRELNDILLKYLQLNSTEVIYSKLRMNEDTKKFETNEIIFKTVHHFIIHIKNLMIDDEQSSESVIYYHPKQESELKLFINQTIKTKKML